MKKLTKAAALKMSKDERKEYMKELHEKLRSKTITLEEFEAARQPIRAAIEETF